MHNKGIHQQNKKTTCGMEVRYLQMTNKGLITHTTQSKKKKQTPQSKKWSEDLNGHFSRWDTQMVNRHMRRHPASLMIRVMQVTTMLSAKGLQIKKCWWGCGKKGTLVYCWWECKLVQSLCKTVWKFLEKSKNRTTMWSRNSTPGNKSGKKIRPSRYWNSFFGVFF